MKHLLRIPVLCLIVAAPALAQRGGQQQRPTAPAPTDTNIVKRQGTGFVVNYDDQPLRVVFSALADASGLNIVQTNIPQRNTTLHMGQAVTREQMLEVIKGIAASNNITVIEGASLIRLEGTAPVQQQQNAQQLAQQQAQQAQQQLFIYRLKHASAVQLAPVLQSLFTGHTRTVTTGPQNPIAALLGLGGQTQTVNVGPGGITTTDVPTPTRGNAGVAGIA